MPFNLPDDGEALDGVLSVFGNDRAALADLLLAVGKVFVFFFGFVLQGLTVFPAISCNLFTIYD